MSEVQSGMQRRSLLQKILGGSLLGAAGLTGLFTRQAVAAEAPVTAPLLRNVGVTVANLEKSTKFYTEVFGYKADAKPTKIGAVLSPLMEVENLDLTIQYIETGGPVRIELLYFGNPKSTGDGSRHPINTRGLSHWQIRVPNVNATVAKVKAAGGTVLENTRFGKPDAPVAIFVLDPDGTRIELVP